ncbi:MAG: dephospho-CoA kinase [Gemmatimonadetes bacterium]|nr:dephospho-CoA kinase [Gemmatimonadota bacterium]
MMLRVGLTGNVASGKSTISARWRAEGVPVLDADVVAREVVAPGSPALDLIREAFGGEVIQPDGGLDRAALRSRVFADAAARRRLEEITHPRIRERVDAWLEEQEAAGATLAVVEIPLLFEVGRDGAVDHIVFVDAPVEVRLRRLMDGRGLDAEAARAIIDAQGDPVEKRGRSHDVIDNDSTVGALEAAADALLARLRERASAVGDAAGAAAAPLREGSPPEGWMRVDLHMHTRGSWDCRSDPEAVLARALARGVERIAITDHNELAVALEMAARHPHHVIPGEEVKTAEGIDVIGLYLSECIPKGTPAEETCRLIRAQGGIPYLPHPYARGKGGGGRYAERLAPLCDVVEVFNARLHPARLNDPAPDLATRHGALRGAGSDAHTVGEVAGAYVELPRHPNTPHALRSALARGRVHGRTSSNLVHLASTWAKLRKKLPGG